MNGHGWLYSAEEVISDEGPFVLKNTRWVLQLSQDGLFFPSLLLNFGNRREWQFGFWVAFSNRWDHELRRTLFCTICSLWRAFF